MFLVVTRKVISYFHFSFGFGVGVKLGMAVAILSKEVSKLEETDRARTR